MACLDMSVKERIPVSDRQIVVEHLWGTRESPRDDLPEGQAQYDALFDTYFDYYAAQCAIIDGKHSSVKTHSDIMNIALLLWQPLTREEVLKQMSEFLRDGGDDQHDSSINLVARLLLMIKFGKLPHECLGGRSIEWNSGTFSEFIHGHFSRPPAYNAQTCTHAHIKLGKQFNALNLQRIAGIQIFWTDNLADHLRMMDDDKTLAVFYHASFLEYHLHKYVRQAASTIPNF